MMRETPVGLRASFSFPHPLSHLEASRALLGLAAPGGEASDSRNFEVLLDLGPDADPRAVVADKGFMRSRLNTAQSRGAGRFRSFVQSVAPRLEAL
jgi:hypothetical protein